MPTRRRQSRKRGPAKRKVAGHVTSTKLWLMDLATFDDERVRKRISTARLLREIVHSWAVTRRLSGELTDVLEAVVGRTQERIIADQMAPLTKSILLVLDQVTALSISERIPQTEQASPQVTTDLPRTRASKNGNGPGESGSPSSSSTRQLCLWQLQ